MNEFFFFFNVKKILSIKWNMGKLSGPRVEERDGKFITLKFTSSDIFFFLGLNLELCCLFVYVRNAT